MQAVVLLLRELPLEPLSNSTALLDVGTRSLIELTLSYLERQGLSEVHLVAAAQADQLSAHLKAAGWTAARGAGGMAVHVLPAPGCRTEGEALRLVEERDVIKGDFVLLIGAAAANADLRPVVQAHLARRAADRQAIMTLVMHGGRAGGGAAAPLAAHDRCLAVLDPRSLQLLKLELGGHGAPASLSTQLLGERNSITVRSDLRLTGVYVCAPDVLMLLSDNFDYQTVARDLVPGVLSEQELGSTLHIHELFRGYVERVQSLATYKGVVEDVLSRWAYPCVPDNSGAEHDSCRFNRGTYVDASATIASGSYVSKGSLVGRDSTVDAGARLDRCVVGSECHIGRGAALQGSCLQPRVRVDDGCMVSAALLGEQAVLRSHAKVETGAVLAKHTVVDTAHCVPAGARVSLVQPRSKDDADSDDDEDWGDADARQLASAEAAAAALAAGGIPEAALGFDEAVVGSFGAGYAWVDSDSPGALASLLGAAPPADSDADSEAGDFMRDAPGAVEEAGVDELAAVDQFKREVAETFLRCIKEGISQDNAVIELNGLKIAEDRTFADCARYMFTTMLGLCLPPAPAVKAEYRSLYPDLQVGPATKEGRLELLRRINAQLRAWKELLHRFLRSADDQVELLLTFEEYCAEEGDFAGEQGATFADLFPQVVKLCYDHDLLSEEAILDWSAEKENASKEDRHFLELCADLIAWLEDASEEESSEEED